jgi:hypothetical protein
VARKPAMKPAIGSFHGAMMGRAPVSVMAHDAAPG